MACDANKRLTGNDRKNVDPNCKCIQCLSGFTKVQFDWESSWCLKSTKTRTTSTGINHWLLPEVGLFYFSFIPGPCSLLMFAFNIVFLHLLWSRGSAQGTKASTRLVALSFICWVIVRDLYSSFKITRVSVIIFQKIQNSI